MGTLILPWKYRLPSVSSETVFKMLQSRSKLVTMLSACKTAWIRVRRWGTRCL